MMKSSGLCYEGPIYRPPSEAQSLLIQATIGCPHNKCTFCMVYKNGPPFRIRPVEDIKRDLTWAQKQYGNSIKTVFFPSGNTIVMKTNDLVEILHYTWELFPNLQRITIYGSAQYITKKGLAAMQRISKAGLSRIHVGLESGDNTILLQIKKGSTTDMQTQAGKMVKDTDIELSEYIILGLGGKKRTKDHIKNSITVLNQINPDFIRIRTLLPKINTPLLQDIQKGFFQVLTPHEVLDELKSLIQGLEVTSQIVSDHYTNYVNVCGTLPKDRAAMLTTIKHAQQLDESHFRKTYIGTE